MSKPFISVIMPAFNELDTIEDSIGSVLAQETPDMEVLLVDGNSTDGTTEAISRIAERDNRVRLLHNPHRKTPCAFNIGLSAARGEYVCIFGAHAVYAPDYIRVCLRELLLHDAVGCSGRIVTVPANRTLQAQLAAWTLGSRFGSSSRSVRTRTEGFADTIPYPLFRKQALLEIGGYDESLDRNQDLDINQRLRARGYGLYLTAKTHCGYRGRPTIAALWRYAFHTGSWNGVTLCRKPASMSFRHFVPALFVTALLVLVGMGAFCEFLQVYSTSAVIKALLVLVGVHLTLGVAAGAATAMRTKAFAPLLLPIVILGFHIAYGWGTLSGLSSKVRVPSHL